MTPPPPRANPDLIGHAAAEAALFAAMRGGRLHHAWLITGPEGVGKATLAYRFARRLLAGLHGADSLALDPRHPVFRRVAAASHADLFTLEREWDPKRKRMRGEIVVDTLHTALSFLTLTPAEGGWRVVIVDGAEHLNRHAANGLLKILEEPPKQAILLLVCAAPGRLLATIRSRCRRLRLDPLAPPAMREVLQTWLGDRPRAELDRLAVLGEGSPGRALALAEQEGIAVAGLVDDVLGALPDLAELRAYEVADALGRSDGGFTHFMELLRASLALAVRQAVRGQADAQQMRLAQLRPLAAWCDVWQGLTRLQDDTEHFNLDKRQAVISGLELLRGP